MSDNKTLVGTKEMGDLIVAKFIKGSKMKSDNVKKGCEQAPHRSLFNALGLTEEEMDKPLIGIVSSYNEIVLDI